MIKRLRYKFILIATIALLVIQIYVMGITNILTRTYVLNGINTLMNILIEYSGKMPEESMGDGATGMREETPYETRYFSVFIDPDGKAEIVDMSHIAAIEDKEAENLGKRAYMKKRTRGLFDTGDSQYFYAVVKPGAKQHRPAYFPLNGIFFSSKVDAKEDVELNSNEDSKASQNDAGELIIFLDCTQRMEIVFTIRYLSILIGIMSFLLFFAIIWFFSKRAIRPVIRNMEAQEQFITNAGHELKTPLTIISANTEVLEMTSGRNEWTESIKNQVKRLTGLVNSLISLAKIQEGRKPEFSEIDLSDIVKGTAESFRPVVENQEKSLNIEVCEDVKIMGNAGLSKELISILMDNAAKYCDEKGSIEVKLQGSGKNAVLSVANTYEEGKDGDFDRFFERFYREDISHSSEKQGYGIGLSIAARIVGVMDGSVKASYEGDKIIFGITLPLKK